MKSGYVVITGKPNVGKSTFLNHLAKKKIAIVTNKPQTTRNQIKYLYKADDINICFIDTPGYHKEKNKLDTFLNSQIKSSYKNVDCALLLIDLSRSVDEEDKQIIKWLNQYQIKNVIVLFTKLDIASINDIENHKSEINKLINANDIIEISTRNNSNIDKIIPTISKYLTSNDEISIVEQDDKFIIAEIIREQIIKLTKQELPYSISIIVEQLKYEQQENMFHIHASVVVEKQSQKPIIVGEKGNMIKQIGINSRQELLKIYNCKINLQLFVKVKKDWRNDENFLSSINYTNK